MRTKRIDEDDKKEQLSFSFKKQQVEDSQVASHWEKIKARIALTNAKKIKKSQK